MFAFVCPNCGDFFTPALRHQSIMTSNPPTSATLSSSTSVEQEEKESTATELQRLLSTCEVFGANIRRQLDEDSLLAATNARMHNQTPEQEFYLHLAAASTSSVGGVMTGQQQQRPTLLPHQVLGVRWLLALFKNAVNGVLADDMGLGKTIQVIAFLSALFGQRYFGTHLIVVPLSTLDNWKSEFHRWCPWLPLVVFHGPKETRAKLRHWIRTRYDNTWRHQASIASRSAKGESVESLVKDVGGIVVTTYDMIMTDRGELTRIIPWDMLIVDEAHRLKRFDGKLLQRLRGCKAEGRLLLTGTPLQNNVKELWSVLNFIMPEVFGDMERFQGWFESAETVAHSLKAAAAAAAADPVDDPENNNTNNEEGDGDERCQGEDTTDHDELEASISLNTRTSSLNSSHVNGFIDASSSSTSLRGGTAPSSPTSSSLEVSTMLQRMHAALRPFILRRIKADITDLRLPPKREIVLYAPLTPRQEGLYAVIQSSNKYELNRMMQLRKLCCHPCWFPEFDGVEVSITGSSTVKCCDDDPARSSSRIQTTKTPTEQLTEFVSASSKMTMLDKMLRQLLQPTTTTTFHTSGPAPSSPKHKILIFSQFTKVLDFIEDYFYLLQQVADVHEQERQQQAQKKQQRSSSGTKQTNHAAMNESPRFTVSYVRLDGNSTRDERVESIRLFSNNRDKSSKATDRSSTSTHKETTTTRKRERDERGDLISRESADTHHHNFPKGISSDNDVFFPSVMDDNNDDMIMNSSNIQAIQEGQSEATESDHGVDSLHRWEGNNGKVTKTEEPVVFLISTRSGGVGLNLVAADTVILFDSDYNPHNDQQAIDRCYRIGQVRPVVVYRLIAPRTVEEVLLLIAQRKKVMERAVMECGRFSLVDERSLAPPPPPSAATPTSSVYERTGSVGCGGKPFQPSISRSCSSNASSSSIPRLKRYVLDDANPQLIIEDSWRVLLGRGGTTTHTPENNNSHTQLSSWYRGEAQVDDETLLKTLTMMLLGSTSSSSSSSWLDGGEGGVDTMDSTSRVVGVSDDELHLLLDRDMVMGL